MNVSESAKMNTLLPNHSLNELYTGLADNLVSELRKLEMKQVCRAGTKLLICGELPRHLMILETGEAEIFLPCVGRAISLGAVPQGKVFGLKSVIAGEPAEIDIICVTSCSLTLLPTPEFLALLHSRPELYYVVARVLSADLQRADKILKDTLRRRHRAPRGKYA